MKALTIATILLAVLFIGADCNPERECQRGYHQNDAGDCVMDTPTCEGVMELVYSPEGIPACCLPGQGYDATGNCRDPEPHPYTACMVNADPDGVEEIAIGDWILNAASNDGLAINVFPHNSPGCYYFEGPGLTEPLETFILHGTQFCFGDYDAEVTFSAGSRAVWSFYRNDVPCTPDYEVDCRRVDDPAVDDALEDYIGTYDISILNCCNLYDDDQDVCDICPIFPIESCEGAGVIVIDDDCECAEVAP